MYEYHHGNDFNLSAFATDVKEIPFGPLFVYLFIYLFIYMWHEIGITVPAYASAANGFGYVFGDKTTLVKMADDKLRYHDLWALTHRGRVCVSKLTNIGSDYGLLPTKPLSKPMLGYH